MAPHGWLAVALDRRGVQLHDPGAARPGLFDVIGCFLGSEHPAGVTPVTFLLSHCGERDLALSLELAGDLSAERRLVGFDGQCNVGALLEAPAKNACVVCRTSGLLAFSAASWAALTTPVVTINTLLASTRGGLDQSTTNRT